MSPTERRTCFVASTTLLLSTLEYMIPKPLPFMKLGLANLPLLMVLDIFGWKEYLLLSLLKVCGSCIISGTLFSYVFLLVFLGGMLSAIVMKGVSSLLGRNISLLGCSVLGALTSNLVQLWVASHLVYGSSIWVAAPLLLSIGLVSSIVLGLLAETYQRKGHFLDHDFTTQTIKPSANEAHPVPFCILCLVLVLLIIVKKPLPLAICVGFLFCAQTASGRRPRLAPNLILFCSMLMLSLFQPAGKVLLSWGKLAVTEGALKEAAFKAARLIALVSTSQVMVAVMPHIPGTFFAMLSLTLGYFSCFHVENHEGNLLQRIDAALDSSLSGNGKTPRPAKIPLVIVFSGICIAALILFW